MQPTGKKKQFRSRKGDDVEDEEEKGDTPVIRPKAAKPKKKEATKSAMLSFGDDEEQEDEALREALKAKKAKNSKAMRKTLEKMEAEAEEALGAATTSGYGATAGEYTAEKMAELKKSQPFQIRTKSSKKSGMKPRTTPRARDGSSEADAAQAEGPADANGKDDDGDDGVHGDLPRAYDDDEVKRMKDKRERSRRQAMGDFVPLNSTGDPAADDEEASARRRALGSLPEMSHDELEKRMGPVSELQRKSSKAGGDMDMDDWESELIRRGARRGEAMGSHGPSVYGASLRPFGSGAGDSLSSPAGMNFVSVEDVLRDVETTKERVEQAHQGNERAAEKARSELLNLTRGLEKLRTQFEGTAERFEFFQEIREYVSSLCGCLREKEGMIAELVSAISMIRRETTEKRWERRVDEQEDELQDLKESGALESLNGYKPKMSSLLADSSEGPKQVGLDEFGRDKSYHLQKARGLRRDARLQRRQKTRDRLPPGGDPDETEAQLSGAEDSDNEVEVMRGRKRKLLEAASVIFEDTAKEFSDIEEVAKRFEMWKRAYGGDYKHAFVSMSLPQIMEPFVKLEMAGWDPIQTSTVETEFLDGQVWYQRLFNYGQGINTIEEEDPDDRLVPQMVEKVAVPLLRSALLECYDPMSSSHTTNGVALVQHLLVYEPGKQALESLLQAPMTRLKQAVESLCIPLLKAGAGEDAEQYQRRQIFKAAKLYRNLALWHEVLSARALAPLAIGSLLSRVIATALSNRVALASGRGEDRKALVQVLSILQVVGGSTPASWVTESGVNKKELKRLLDSLRPASGGGRGSNGSDPVMATINGLEGSFGL